MVFFLFVNYISKLQATVLHNVEYEINYFNLVFLISREINYYIDPQL